MSNNKDFKIKNDIKPTVYQEKLGTVTTGTVAAGFKPVNTWSYDSVSFSVASQMSNSPGMAFNNDGTKMYVVGDALDIVYQYSLSTAFDLSTASYDSVNFSVNNQEYNPTAVNFNPNGTKMYIQGYGYDGIFQYSLSTAFDLSTASYDNVSFGISGQDGSAYGMCFNNNGTKIYVAGAFTNRVFQYSLSTAYDISTVSYDSVFFSVSTQDSRLRDVRFNADGTKMYIVGDLNNRIYQYSLSTAFDISTASYDSLIFSVGSQSSIPYCMVFNNDGTKMYLIDSSSRTVYQYSSGGFNAAQICDLSTGSVFDVTLTGDYQLTFSNPADSGTVNQATVLLKSSGNHSISYGSSIKFTGGSAPDAPGTNEADVLTFSTRDGGTSYQASHIIDGAA